MHVYRSKKPVTSEFRNPERNCSRISLNTKKAYPDESSSTNHIIDYNQSNDHSNYIYNIHNNCGNLKKQTNFINHVSYSQMKSQIATHKGGITNCFNPPDIFKKVSNLNKLSNILGDNSGKLVPTENSITKISPNNNNNNKNRTNFIQTSKNLKINSNILTPKKTHPTISNRKLLNRFVSTYYYVNRPTEKTSPSINNSNNKDIANKLLDKNNIVNYQNEKTKHKSKNPTCQNVSAWLLQCNNASVMPEENENVVTDFKDPNYDKPNQNLSKSNKKEQLIPIENNKYLDKYEIIESKSLPNSSNKIERDCEQNIENKQKNNQIKELIYKQSKIFPNFIVNNNENCKTFKSNNCQNSIDSLCESNGKKKFPKKVLNKYFTDSIDSNESSNSNIDQNYNSTNNITTDWTSVSSSEWGDDICEFDRQQSFRVHEMFEEIDRILFDDFNFNNNYNPLKHNLKLSNANLNLVEDIKISNSNEKMSKLPDKQIVLNKNKACDLVNLNSSFNEWIDPPDYDLSHLYEECKDWLSRFPHLRVVGTQLIPSQDYGYTFYQAKNINANKLQGNSSEIQPSKGNNMLSDSNKKSNLVENHEKSNSISLTCDLNETDLSFQSIHKQIDLDHSTMLTKSMFPTKSSSSMCAEEILAIDGEYEEIIAIDYFDDNLIVKSDNHSIQKNRELVNMGRKKSTQNNIMKLSIEKEIDNHKCKTIKSENSLQKQHNTKTIINNDGIVDKNKHNKSTNHILRMITKELWTDLIQWLKYSTNNFITSTNLSDTPVNNTNFIQTSFNSIKPKYQSNFRAKNGYIESTVVNSVQQNKVPNLDPTSILSNVDGVELSDLLQISTKTLQLRERTVIQDSGDLTNRIYSTIPNSITNISADQVNQNLIPPPPPPASGSQLVVTTRLSPQPLFSPNLSHSNRPLSNIHNKLSASNPRRNTVTSNNHASDTPISSGVGIVGVAANLHHVSKLAPLDRVRTPLTSQTPNTDEHILHNLNTINLTTPESITTCVLFRAKNLNNSNGHIGHLPSSITHGSTWSNSSVVCTHSTSTSTNVSDSSMVRNLTLPPLSTTTTGSSGVVSVPIQTHNNLNFIANIMNVKVNHPVNKSNFSVHLNTHNMNTTNITTTTTSNTINNPNNNNNHNTQQQTQHTPLLCGTNANLVTQQNNNSHNGLSSSMFIQKISPCSSPHPEYYSCRNYGKNNFSSLPYLHIPNERCTKQQKLWRPYSSRADSYHKQSVRHSINLLTRAKSTVLLPVPDLYRENYINKRNSAVFIGFTNNPLNTNSSIAH